MNKLLLSGVLKILKSRKLNAKLQEGAAEVAHGFEQQRAAFVEKRKSVEKEIERGSRQTEYRLPL